MNRYLALAVLLTACSTDKTALFRLLSPRQTGITFANTITTNDSVNVQTDVYVYNGAGVAIGDVDHDGRPDVFLAGNQVSSRLYRNKGGMRFEDVTDRARVGTTRWATGATMVDINDDGWLDIYVSVSGHAWSKPAERANLLFVNNRDGTFTEAARQYGIADDGFTTHAVFLDYDHDGCIDLFVLNNSPAGFSRAAEVMHPAGMRQGVEGGYNQLYRNNCNGSFTNVSERAGIERDAGYGLGVVVTDVNGDGWPDIYVSNDATPNDVLYVNNRDGTFTNHIEWLKHASYAGMGVDAADFNNDGWPDLVQADMMPHDLSRRKRMSGFMTYASLQESAGRGFRHDYSENSLQLSNGADSAGNPIFSEIARMAGVEATDWSWSTLLADFDNDGWKDLLITNGYPKAVNDFDYQTEMFSLGRNRDSATAQRLGLAVLAKLPAYDVSNYVFRNTGALTFEDVTRAWGMQRPSFSYGAAYADLNGDGALDVVVNNIDAPAFVYENTGSSGRGASRAHSLDVRLRGPAAHPINGAIGATVTAIAHGKRQTIYYSPYRGYMSTMDLAAHFGMGSATRVDTLVIVWPDGARQTLSNVRVDTLLIVDERGTGSRTGPGATHTLVPDLGAQSFRELTLPAIVEPHRLPTQIDYSVQPLLPYMVSRQGPPLAVADIDGDGLDDVFVGGGAGQPGQFLLGDGKSFRAGPRLAPAPSDGADMGAAFFDANGDGRPDLYVATGNYFAAPNSASLQDRLYINKGGRFVLDSAALPPIRASTGVVRAADFDGDGRVDLFVGGRMLPRTYPLPTRSYILRNVGGRFVDVTEQLAPELIHPGGMITDAAWVDVDGDGRLDLVTVGEWMPIMVFRNAGSRFVNVTAAMGLGATRGWWFSLAVGDFDKDGKPDLVAGNLGLNTAYHTSRDTTFGVYAGDLSGRRNTDVILTTTVNDTEYPLAGLVPLGREIYTVGLRFPTYASLASRPIAQVFDSSALRRATHYRVDTFASVVLHNDGGRFSARPLPPEAQISPIRGIVATDVDGDGNTDLVVAGNLFDFEANTAPADAGNGLWLRGDGHNGWTPVPPRVSGFVAPHNVSGLTLANGRYVVVANTGGRVQLFEIGRYR